MENNEPTTVAADADEAALDKELSESIASVQAGKPLAPAPAEAQAPDAKQGDTPAKPQEEPTSPAPNAASDAKGAEVLELRIPNKGKFESDESFEKRVELFDLVKRRRAAVTPEQKEALSQQIQTTKGQLKTINGSDKNINQPNQAEPAVPPQEDEATKADRERLKALGGITKEDMENMISERETTVAIKGTLENFVARHPELKNDADMREVFFDFVDSNYNWSGKTGKDLMTVLELARENMFRPSETIQERVLKGANVQEKVNAMQFPGGSQARAGISADKQKSLDELKGTGLSEEMALQLLED